MTHPYLIEFENQIKRHLNINALNDMQKAVFDAAQTHPFITLLANTGSGKTLAFLSTLFSRFKEPMFQTQAIVITPTRELTLQIEEVAKSLKLPYKIIACYGGHKREIEENELIQAPKLIIGTPGRLCDHIRRGNINLEHIDSLVIDEFDKSLELGYMEEIQYILDHLKNIQHAMFTSATAIEETNGINILEQSHLIDFRVKEVHDWDKIIHQKIIYKKGEDRKDVLYRLLCDIGSDKSTVIFFNFKEDLEEMGQYLRKRGIQIASYHGSMEQYERESAIARFKMGAVHTLLCTDIASRGLDIQNLRYVVHYQMPHQETAFIHRNGRTARMDASGTIIAFINDEVAPEYFDQDQYKAMNVDNFSDVAPEKAKWVCFEFPFGKKNKVNKVDIVGFLIQKGDLKKEDIGLIDIKDFNSFVAVRKGPSAKAFDMIKNERIKGKISKVSIVK